MSVFEKKMMEFPTADVCEIEPGFYKANITDPTSPKQLWAVSPCPLVSIHSVIQLALWKLRRTS